MSKKKVRLYVKFNTNGLIYWKLIPVGTELDLYEYKYDVEHEISNRYTMNDVIDDFKSVLLAFSSHMIRNEKYTKESNDLCRLFEVNISKALNSNWDNKFSISDTLGGSCSIFIYYNIEEVKFEPYTLYLRGEQIKELHTIAFDNQKSISEPFNETMRNVVDALISAYKEVHEKDGEDM